MKIIVNDKEILIDNPNTKITDIGKNKIFNNISNKVKKQYKYLLIDLDETIFDFYLSEKKAIKRVLEEFNISYNEAILKYFSKINDELFLEFQAKKYTRIEFQHKRFEALFKYLKVDNDYVLANNKFVSYLANGSDLLPNAIEALEYLYNKGYLLYAASNGQGHVQKSRLINSNTFKYFTALFISGDIGHNKPEKEFFSYVIEAIKDDDLSNYLMIGDNVSSDILGATNYGIDTLYLNRDNNETNIATYMIRDIIEVKEVL